jgi:hypothetical protein
MGVSLQNWVIVHTIVPWTELPYAICLKTGKWIAKYNQLTTQHKIEQV